MSCIASKTLIIRKIRTRTTQYIYIIIIIHYEYTRTFDLHSILTRIKWQLIFVHFFHTHHINSNCVL